MSSVSIIWCEQNFLLVSLLIPFAFSFKNAFSDWSVFGEKSGNKLSFEEEYKLFEEELNRGIASHEGKSRKKRYVYLNTQSNVDVGFLIVTPITVVLPAMTNLFNNWRRKRSVENFYSNDSTEGSSFQGIQAMKISSYFDLINIPEVPCQLRAICDFSADPSTFFPLSDIMLSKLITGGNYAIQSANSTSTLYQKYAEAYDQGVTFGAKKCTEIYGNGCKYPTEKLLNMPVLKFWNKVQTKLRLKFEDVSEPTVQNL